MKTKIRRRDVCIGPHDYVKMRTVVGLIWQCLNCWNWTMKKPSRIPKEYQKRESFIQMEKSRKERMAKLP